MKKISQNKLIENEKVKIENQAFNVSSNISVAAQSALNSMQSNHESIFAQLETKLKASPRCESWFLPCNPVH